MTDQHEPAGLGRSRRGTARRHDPSALSAPIAHWPGEPVQLSTGEVFVRYAPGPPGAEPAIFVHGLGGSAVNWTDLLGLLSQPSAEWPGLYGSAPDLPGFGYSPVPANGDYSLDTRSDVVIELIEHGGNPPVHLVGNSMGGAIATRIAARRPDLVETLTLISPALPDLSPRLLPLRLALVSTPGVGRVILHRMLQIPAEKRTDMSIGDLFADPSLMPPERRAQAVREVERRDDLSYSRRVLIESGRALVAEYIRRGPDTLWRDAARVTAPTLVLYGSHDKLVNPATAARAARTFRSCRVVVLPRTGHVAMMERPDLVAAEMREFIASVSDRGHKAAASAVND
jgi:pimeloyl-ACP methyl ester carboxylesterase